MLRIFSGLLVIAALSGCNQVAQFHQTGRVDTSAFTRNLPPALQREIAKGQQQNLMARQQQKQKSMRGKVMQDLFATRQRLQTAGKQLEALSFKNMFKKEREALGLITPKDVFSDQPSAIAAMSAVPSNTAQPAASTFGNGQVVAPSIDASAAGALPKMARQATAVAGKQYAKAPAVPFEQGFGIAHLSARLTTTKGKTLYVYEGGLQQLQACVGECLKTFQPYLVEAGAPPRREFTHVIRPDGSLQWAVNNKLLFTYVGDAKPRQKNGDGFNAVWTSVPYPYEGAAPLALATDFVDDIPPTPELAALQDTQIQMQSPVTLGDTVIDVKMEEGSFVQQATYNAPPFPSSADDLEWAKPFFDAAAN